MPAIDARKDYYALLQLEPFQLGAAPARSTSGQAELPAGSITSKDIKTAYYGLAKVFHPDKTGGNEQAAEHFKKLLEAYEVLSDPTTRRLYDDLRAEVIAAQRAQAFHTTQTSEFGAWNVRGDRQNQARERTEQRKRAGAKKGNANWTYANAGQWQPPPTAEGSGAGAQKQKGKPQNRGARAETRRARPDSAQAESQWHQAGGENCRWSYTPAGYFTPQPPPPHPERTDPVPPEPTPDLPKKSDFSIYTFDHYFDNTSRARAFLGTLRRNVNAARHEVRKAQTAVYVARYNLSRFGSSYPATVHTMTYERELQEQETRQIWWKQELKRRERWLRGHEQMAKLRRGLERMRIIKEGQEEASKRAIAQERENVKNMAEAGKVEVIEIDDSDADDDSLFGEPLHPSQEDELLGDTTIGSSL